MVQNVGEERVLILPGLQADEPCDVKSFTLSRPNGKPQSYMICNGVLQEVNRFKQQYSAWVVDERLIADGGMYLATPVDPVLVLVPLLDRARDKSASCPDGMFKQLDELLYDAAVPELAQLMEQPQARERLEQQLACVCTTRQSGSDTFYRLDEERVVAWLRCKFRQVQETMAQQVAGMDAPHAHAYVTSFLAEYVTEEWMARLAASLSPGGGAGGGCASPSLAAHVDAEPASAKRDAAGGPGPGGSTPAAGAPPEKKQKTLVVDPKALASQRQAEARQAALAKTAVGTKKISNFFAKPPAAAAAKSAGGQSGGGA